MLPFLQIVTLVLITVALALSLAHALELLGKLRLDKQSYYAVQSIYYPGFTVGGGIGDAGGTLVLIVLLFMTPTGTTDFWLTLIALLGMLAMQAVYWLVTHPVNQFWVEGVKMNRVSSGFFSLGAHRARQESAPDWTKLRDRWEFSHVARAGFTLVSFIALLIAISSIA